MKSLVQNISDRLSSIQGLVSPKQGAFFGLALILFSEPSGLNAQSTYCDNFNDGNDSFPLPPWQHYDPLIRGTWSFPNGNTYRIQTAPSPDPGTVGQARVGSIRPENYTNFYVSADIVNWDDSLPQFCGVAARLSNIGLGTTTGYLFGHDRGDTSSMTSGDMDILRIDGEFPTDLDPSGVMDGIHLVPGKSYRFVFIGVGDQLTGKVYELPDTSSPIINYTVTENTYASGVSGIVVADNSANGDQPGDMTFDNFLSTTAEPVLSVELSSGTVRISWPNIPSFTLQSTSSLSAPNWADIMTGITTEGDRKVYTVTSPSGHAFFRLAEPCS